MVLPHTKSPTLNTFHSSSQIFVYHYLLNIIQLLLLLLDALHFSFDTVQVGQEMWDCLPRVLPHSCQPGHQVDAGRGGGGGAQAGKCHVEGREGVRGCGDVGLSSTCTPPLPI